MDAIAIKQDPYSSLKPGSLRRQAAAFVSACYCPGDAGYCSPRGSNWRYEAEYDISTLIHLMPEGWPAWFDEELALYREMGTARQYERMLEEDIEEAIIVLERDGKGYIWDGWHRTGATFKKGQTKMRAIVGTPWRGE